MKEVGCLLEGGRPSTDSGYQAAVPAHLVKHVCSIEIVEELAGSAAQVLQRLDYSNVTVRAGDGYAGWRA